MGNKQKLRNRHREFLLSFFSDREEYQIKEINGFILVKYFMGDEKEKWNVAIYTKESYKIHSDAKLKFKEQKLF